MRWNYFNPFKGILKQAYSTRKIKIQKIEFVNNLKKKRNNID